MIEKCYDEGTFQAFLDNELTSELSQKVARHVADCDLCAVTLAEVEEETAFAFSLLEREYDTLVPTQRLWTKINESIESQSRQRSIWQTVSAVFSGLSFTNPQVVAFGSLLLIVGIVSTLIFVKNDDATSVSTGIAANNVSPVQINQNEPALVFVPPTVVDQNAKIETVKSKSVPQYQITNANYVENNRKRVIEPSKDYVAPQPVVPQYLDGEESYVATIARLEKTVNENKDEVLKPSARFSYEKNLAVVNDTISKMKREVRRNPKNADAKQILFASYQNKIELLNSVNQQGELMASLR